jgi:DNA-binding transcriptional MocR family regulator
VPPDGIAIWIRCRPRTDVDDWARRSLEHGMAWYPGRRYAFDQLPKPFARFSFACLNESELVEAREAVGGGAGLTCAAEAARRNPGPGTTIKFFNESR